MVNSTQNSQSKEVARGNQPRNRAASPFWEIMGNFFSNCFHRVEGSNSSKSPLVSQNGSKVGRNARVEILLKGCETVDEHWESVRSLLEAAAELRGSDGLRKLGLEFRTLHCDEHKVIAPSDFIQESDDDDLAHGGDEGLSYDVVVNGGSDEDNDDDDDATVEGEVAFAALAKLRTRLPRGSSKKSNIAYNEMQDSNRSNDGSFFSTNVGASHFAEAGTTDSHGAWEFDNLDDGYDAATMMTATEAASRQCGPLFCHLCTRRLFHIDSNTMVNDENRKEFIADGAMYEVASRLGQEAAQDVMIEEGKLEWVTVEEASEEHTEPIKVLISSEHPILTKQSKGKSTVLICTGRGKVKGGIFSRQHLICSGLELATAIPLVRDAVTRNMNIAILDPNVRGEALGYTTFQKTMDFFDSGHIDVSEVDQTRPSCRDVYVVSHSASGGHMVRYFLDKCEGDLLSSIRAVAFTDSTHSIQWAKSTDQTSLFDLLQSEKSVYFRCTRARDSIAGGDNKWYLHPAGEPVQTDSFWRHRFGTIRTMWAGTNEHSLTNWYSHHKIWEHFDYFLYGRKFSRNNDGSATFHSSDS